MLAAAAENGIAAEPAAKATDEVTFNKHVAPLLFAKCAGCHHEGEVAPFSLLTYADAKKRAPQIAQVTADRYMPPWKSLAGHGRFVGERRLTNEEITLVRRWNEQGALEGDAPDLPPAPQFSDGWKLGQPDMIVTLDQPYAIPADGPDIYRNFVLPLHVPAGKYIKALEFRPSNRRVVHHAVFSVDVTPRSRQQDEADPLPGFKGSLNIPGRMFPGSMAAWTPGREAMPLPDGLSMPWKEGADLVLQLHLHPSGKTENEQSSIGFFFTGEPPRRSMVDVAMIDRNIDIPPGEPAFRTRDEIPVPVDVDIFGIFPHMHLIGREMKVTAHPPSGEPISLIWIDDWDFNWQNFYQYDPPLRIPAGSKIVMAGLHDNSADNFRNPNVPPKRVTGGEQTTNEMSAALLQFVPVREADLDKLIEANQRRVLGVIDARRAQRDRPVGGGP